MNSAVIVILVCLALALTIARALYQRGMHRWFPAYLRQASERQMPRAEEAVHLLLCIADHFEPGHGKACPAAALSRVRRWVEEYPQRFVTFRDSDGRSPQHTFFYPLEMYDPTQVELLAKLTRAGHGEIEVHLHHDRDNAENLRGQLLEYKHLLASQHGLLSRRRGDGEIVYGFVHGNWALDNSRPDGRCCGVYNELDVLREARSR